MSEKPPLHTPEKNELLGDNARKFIIESPDRAFLEAHEVTSYTLIVDWLETGADNEKKIAYKQFENGDTKILLIAKVTKDGNRTAIKDHIAEERYRELRSSSILHLEKKRCEFEYSQHTISFSIKFDTYPEGELCILEVDAPSEAERNSFNPLDFPATLTEVTGDIRYYGYRVADMI